MSHVKLYLILFLTSCSITFSQIAVEDTTFYNVKFVVDSIKITGNNSTEEFIITRELTFKVGDSVSTSILHFNRERVFSLGLFNRVEIIKNVVDEKNIVQIDLNETWYIYPLPFYKTLDNTLDKLTYGVKLKYRNFRGRNETIRAQFGLGYDPFIYLLYENPALIHEQSLSLTTSFGYFNFNNRSTSALKLTKNNFDYTLYRYTIGLGKRLDQFNSIGVSAGFEYYQTNTIILPSITASNTNIDRVYSLSASYLFDSRDLTLHSSDGSLAFLGITNKGLGIFNINYNVLEVDLRKYKTIVDELSIRARVNYRSVFGENVPFYDYSYLGYDEFVRGNVNNKKEGKSLILTSLEINYPLIQEWNFSIKLPLLPLSMTSARIGIYLSGFVDSGATFSNIKNLSFNNFYSGYGLGITFLILPYNAVRIEYALNELGKGEIILATGFSF